MRILLIILQTAAFLVLLAAVLVSLGLCAGKVQEPQTLSLPVRVVVFVFGTWVIDIVIFLIVAALNTWFVLGPLMKVEDPVRRTLQHLCVIVIETLILLAVASLAFISMYLSTT